LVSLVFIIAIIIIILKAKDKAEERKTNIERASKYREVQSHYDDPGMRKQNNSYYTKEKIASYKKMERDHESHEKDDGDLIEEIGYVKCPHCGAIVSKKSKVCFLCDANLVGAKKISD